MTAIKKQNNGGRPLLWLSIRRMVTITLVAMVTAESPWVFKGSFLVQGLSAVGPKNFTDDHNLNQNNNGSVNFTDKYNSSGKNGLTDRLNKINCVCDGDCEWLGQGECPWGITLDFCGCCLLCSRGEGEPCGGAVGTCAKNLVCHIKNNNKVVNNNRSSEGTCSRSSEIRNDTCKKAINRFGCIFHDGSCLCETHTICPHTINMEAPFLFPSQQACWSRISILTRIQPTTTPTTTTTTTTTATTSLSLSASAAPMPFEIRKKYQKIRRLIWTFKPKTANTFQNSNTNQN